MNLNKEKENMISILMLLASRVADDSDFDDYLAPKIDKLLAYLGGE
jgi:hypothetical protein